MYRILVAVLGMGVSSVSMGASLKCNKKQTRCSIENVRFTIGDNVAVLNEGKELVATAKVDGIQGRNRKLAIEKRHGKILAGYKVKRIEDDQLQSVSNTYATYKPAADKTIGASADLTSIGVGEGAFSFAGGGYYESKIKKHLYWTGRGLFLTGSGNVRNRLDPGESVLSMYAFGAMGGIVYKTARRSNVVIRSEADLGFAYVSADVDGDPELLVDTVDKISNGFGLLAKMEVSAVYKGMSWNPALIGSYGVIHSARATSIGIGISKSLD